tara:strand:- start:654 stop:953 length:300 start_codon:yes stop_codon:yes gene_type:complete
MSTSFSLQSDVDQEQCIALRFWGGEDNKCTVRFSFPFVLLEHLEGVTVIGCNGEATTIKALFEQAFTHDFLTPDNSIREHISFGTEGSREQARLAWEAQ